MGHHTPTVAQCPGLSKRQPCGQWFNEHASGLCKVCRHIKATTPARKARKQTRTPEYGSQQWAESRGGLIGGYETD